MLGAGGRFGGRTTSGELGSFAWYALRNSHNNRCIICVVLRQESSYLLRHGSTQAPAGPPMDLANMREQGDAAHILNEFYALTGRR